MEKEVEELGGLREKEKDLFREGRFVEAIPYAERILAIQERISGKENPDVAESLDRWARLYMELGQFEKAEPLYRRTLEIRERIWGKEHPDYADSLYHLAMLFRATGHYDESEQFHKKALDIRERVLGKHHIQTAQSYYGMAMVHFSKGRFPETESLYKKALEIRERVLGKKHSDIAHCMSGLASVYTSTGRYREAESLYKTALGMREDVLGKDHPGIASDLDGLGSLYNTIGQYAEAEPLFKRALEIRERVFGKDHLHIAITLHSLGWLYLRTARFSEAETCHKRGLEIREKVLGKDNPKIAPSLNSLAWLYHTRRRYIEAEPLFKKAIEIREKALGIDHPDVASFFNNLGNLYFETKRFNEAEQLHTRALKIRKKALGKTHPDIAQSLTNLASVYRITRQYDKAEPLLKEAIEIREKVFGNAHPDLALSINRLALLYALTNQHSKSHQLFKKGIAVQERLKENAFLVLSEKQKLNYIENHKKNMNMFITHTALDMPFSDQAILDTFNMWIRWKGAVLEAQGRYLDAVMHSDHPEVQKRFDELTQLRRDIARLQLSRPETMMAEDFIKRLEELEKKKESLETELSRLSKDFGLERTVGEADVKRITNVFPKDSVYIDFALIQMHKFRGQGKGPLRYLAFLLIPGKETTVKLIEIENKNKIDPHIQAYLKEMERVKQTKELPNINVLRREGRILYELVMKPIEPYLRGKKQVFISPDGMLNLIPFEVLISGEGITLLEEYLIHYVATGRDMVRFSDTTVAKGEALIMADPDYNMGLKERDKVAGEMKLAKAIRGEVSRDAGGLNFFRLPETREEADNIEKILVKHLNQPTRNYQNINALEEILFSADSPKILHLATHGYFLKDEEMKEILTVGSEDQESDEVPGMRIENPMLRSGIVLAGANVSLKEGRDDGVVSAEKILGLRLKGTEMVVLSACETGVGEVRSGEGVFGLKRAFILSGAKTVVMSLWSVPSKETTELMTRFYTLMAEGKTKAEALRQAKTEMMMKKKNPFYWGAFVMVGKPE